MTVKTQAVNAIKTEIANDLIVDYVIDHLIQVNVFTEEEKDLILALGQDIGSREDLEYRNDVLRLQSEHFLELLIQKMAYKRFDFALNAFLHILRDGTYPWIADKILNQIDEQRGLDELTRRLSSEIDAQHSHSPPSRGPASQQEAAAANALPNTHKNITLADIRGYEDQINQLKDLIETPFNKGSQLKHTSISWPKTALLYGPMGVGKTSICNALCSEFSQKMFCMYVNCGTILTKKIDRSKENLNSIIENGIQKSPSLVILDNCEIICSKTDNGLVCVLGSLLNDLPKDKHVVVILVTNRLEMIDDSLRRAGRIDREIECPFPDQNTRFKIFKKFLNEDTCNVLDFQLKMFSKKREIGGFSGADLELICKESNFNAAKSERKITLRDLEAGLESVLNTTKRRHSINVACLVKDNDTPPRRPLTFVRSLSASDRVTEWPQPNPITFERLNFATPPDKLALFGPPGSCRSLIAEAQSSQSPVNFLSIDLSPENTNDGFDESVDIPFIDDNE